MLRDPHGVRKLAAFVDQNGARYRVWRGTPRIACLGQHLEFHRRPPVATPQLKDGKAQLIV